MSEITPGPWRWLRDDLIGDAGRTTIIRDGEGIYNATEGDKKLIAAAPDLLAALERINRMTSAGSRTLDDFIRDIGWVCDEARRAIAKAIGQGSGA